MDNQIEISAPHPDTDAIRERWFAEVRRATEAKERKAAAISTVLACALLAGLAGAAIAFVLA